MQKASQARTLTASITLETKSGKMTASYKGSVSLQKPNKLHLEISNKPQQNLPEGKVTMVSDGKNRYSYMSVVPQTYYKQPITSNDEALTGFGGDIEYFFTGDKKLTGLKVTFTGTETVNGILCDIVKTTQAGRTTTYAIGHSDKWVYRSSSSQKFNEQMSLTQTVQLQNIKVNVDLSPSLFAFVPPKGAKLFDPADMQKQMGEGMKQYEAKLVKVGEEAPAFELTNPKDKSRFSLAKAMDGRKVVLVNFWFYG